MFFKNRLRRLARIGLAAAERLEPFVPLVTRAIVGYAFLRTGLGKWQHFDRAVDFFEASAIPLPALSAGLVSTAEFLGGALLVLGLRTRLFAALLAVVMTVALGTADRERFVAALAGGETWLTDVVAFVFLLFVFWLAAFGAGPLSLDRLLHEGRPVISAGEARAARLRSRL